MNLVSKYAAGWACSELFIEDILKCVVKHITTDLCFKTTVQLNLNLTSTRVWHVSFWANFLCHSHVTPEKIIKIYIYTHVTLESLDKFIGSLVSCTWSEQLCLATRELHVSTEQICWAICELHASAWSNALVKCATHEEHTYYIMCKMQEWLQHLWIRLQLAHHMVYSHWPLLHQPVIFQYRLDCCSNPSVSAY